MRRAETAALGLALISFLVSIYFYPQAPEQVATHWNARGEVDGYSSKSFGLFVTPVLLVGVAVLFIAIPRIDPLKANIQQFRSYYDGLMILICLFLVGLDCWLALWSIGIRTSPNLFIPAGIGLLLFYMGIVSENSKRNWFVGIRTPWTLSSDTVWEKTHRLGGKLLKAAGVAAVAGVFFPGYSMFFVFVPVFAVTIYTVVYSYLEYQKETASQGTSAGNTQSPL